MTCIVDDVLVLVLIMLGGGASCWLKGKCKRVLDGAEEQERKSQNVPDLSCVIIMNHGGCGWYILTILYGGVWGKQQVLFYGWYYPVTKEDFTIYIIL